jgi:hypothetical protein
MKDLLLNGGSLSQGLSPLIFERSDFWRMPRDRFRSAKYKEWSHFCVLAEKINVIVNFSLMARGASSDGETSEIPRVAILVRQSDGTWNGDVAQFSAESATTGDRATDLTIGNNCMRFYQGAYRVDAELECAKLSMRLCFYPVTRPAIASSVRLSGHERMRWLVVPRLIAGGELRVAGRDFAIQGAAGYHDRNWGKFSWGGDYSWEWATILPASLSIPWTLIYMRISDGGRNRVFSQGLMVWRRDRSARVFHGADMLVRQSGLLKQKQVLRVPRIVNLMVPGEARSIPRIIEIDGRAWADHITLKLRLEDFAEIGVPNDNPNGLTLLSEATGRAEVTGRIGGESFDFLGNLLVEFNHGTT